MPSYFIWDQPTWYGCGTISNTFATCVFWAIICLYYCSPPHHPPILADIAIIIGVFCSYEYIEGIWVFKLWTNSIFWCCVSLFLNATFGHGNMNCWPKCNVCVLEAKIWYLWGNMTLGPPPMGIYWMGEWFFGVPYRFYNLRRSYLYYNS
jgi:hypothetical protein